MFRPYVHCKNNSPLHFLNISKKEEQRGASYFRLWDENFFWFLNTQKITSVALWKTSSFESYSKRSIESLFRWETSLIDNRPAVIFKSSSSSSKISRDFLFVGLCDSSHSTKDFSRISGDDFSKLRNSGEEAEGLLIVTRGPLGK